MKRTTTTILPLGNCVFYDYHEYDNTNKGKRNKGNKGNKDKTHKVVRKTPSLQNELTNQQKLTRVNHADDIKRHFYFCDNNYELVVKHSNIHNMYKPCKPDDSILLEFEDRQLCSFENHLRGASTAARHMSAMLDSYQHLLYSIQLLIDQTICHNHIQLDTIKVD